MHAHIYTHTFISPHNPTHIHPFGFLYLEKPKVLMSSSLMYTSWSDWGHSGIREIFANCLNYLFLCSSKYLKFITLLYRAQNSTNEDTNLVVKYAYNIVKHVIWILTHFHRMNEHLR